VDLASIIINSGLFVATVIAAIVAWRGVRDAQSARDDAAVHEAEALRHAGQSATAATESAAAQQRAAQALEEANRREDSREARRTQWTVTRAGGDRWRVSNNTGGLASDVEFEPVDGERVQMEDGLQLRDVAAGQPVFIHFGGGMTDPPTATLRAEWNDSFDRAQTAVVVLG
jgi:sRNA-binding protein